MEFKVPGPPCGKGRPRFTTSGGQVRTYTPRKTEEYEELVGWCYRAAGGKMIEGPVSMKVTAYFRIPGGMSRATRNLMLAGEIFPTKKPDADNILKAIMDGLNNIAYRDDSQVISVMFMKKYTGGEPYASVEVKEEG